MKLNKGDINCLLKEFEGTINTNLKLATKEVWVISDDLSKTSLEVSCIVRHLITNLNPTSLKVQRMKANWVLNLAKRDIRTLIVSMNGEILTKSLTRRITHWTNYLFRLNQSVHGEKDSLN